MHRDRDLLALLHCRTDRRFLTGGFGMLSYVRRKGKKKKEWHLGELSRSLKATKYLKNKRAGSLSPHISTAVFWETLK